LTGLYTCNKNLLTPEELTQVQAAQAPKH